jgi:phosphoribosylanthranilate isomerase
MLVKICGITSIEDALHAALSGAGALGFNFWPASPRYVRPGEAGRIAASVPREVLKVGVFVDTPADEIESIAAVAGLDVAQLHGPPDRPLDIAWWQALDATAPGLRETMDRSPAEAFLLDAPSGARRGGTGRTFDWSLAAGHSRRIILAGGLGPDNVEQAIRAAKPWGVDACSRLEISPGRKDPALVEEFIRRAQSAAQPS